MTLSLPQKKIVDNSAKTIAEIAEAIPCGESTAARWVKHKLDAGEIERVWKKGTHHLIPAYRDAKKGRAKNG